MTLIFHGDCRAALKIIPDCTIQTCVTSPPYFGLRDYDHEGQIGLELTPDEFVAAMVDVFREMRRCLRDDGTLWLNLGDSYATDSKWGGSTGGKAAKGVHGLGGGGRGKTKSGLPDKNLLGIPWRVAFALQADDWYLRQDIIWHKPNPMPESVTDRCTKAHEYIFLFSKSPRYYFDADAIKEPVADATRLRLAQAGLAGQAGSDRVPGKTNGNMKAVGNGETRNRRSVWTVTTKPYRGAHFATFPPDLIEPCVLAGAPVGGVVYDPFLGSGTTVAVASQHGRLGWGSEINADYIELAKTRIGGEIDVVPV